MNFDLTEQIPSLKQGDHLCARAAEVERVELFRQRTVLTEAECARKNITTILGSIIEGLVALDDQWRFTYLNQAAEKMLRRSASELIGKICLQEFPAMLGTELESQFKRAVAEGVSVEFEYLHEPWQQWFAIKAFPSTSGGLSVHFRDVTERKQDENASRRLAAIVESSDDAIISKDLNGVITSWNRGAERIFGYTAEEVIGQPVILLIPPERHDEEPGILARVRRGERIDHYETIRRRKDGRLIDISLTVSPLKDDHGRIIGASKIARDVTEQKRAACALQEAKEQLAKSNEQLEQRVRQRTAELAETNNQLEAFVYSIAHDLRAPLRSMQAFSTMLLDEYASQLDDTAKNYARRIVRASESMDAMVLDLLAYGRTARSEISLTAVEVRLAWAAAVAQNEQIIFETKAKVKAVPPLPRVWAHEASLVQALANLLSNGLKFVAPAVTPHIRLTAEDQLDVVRLWVEDNGIGIAPEYHERVFRVFERLDGKHYGGTGIGLAIVRKGIERMGGRVGIVSEPNRGSRFWIELRKA